MIITGIFLLFGSIEDAFNTIWRVQKRRPFVKRFVTFWTFLAFLPIVMVKPIYKPVHRTSSAGVDLETGALFVWHGTDLVLPFCIIDSPFGDVYPHPQQIRRYEGGHQLVVALMLRGDRQKQLFAHYVTISSITVVYGSLWR
ncbi:MAG: hypothetical protein H6751_02500 [Candidatus Omnitrophica bacterium]|nr:hypothetical protein [Candidatus Omnitrophota bacterium]